MPAFTTTIDVPRNLARTRFRGKLTAAEKQAAAAELKLIVQKLNPGFTLFANFEGVTSMDLNCAPYLTKIMDILHAHGMGMVVRILPNKAATSSA